MTEGSASIMVVWRTKNKQMNSSITVNYTAEDVERVTQLLRVLFVYFLYIKRKQ